MPVAVVELEYGTYKRSLASESSRVAVDHAQATAVKANWRWEMKKTGSLPPGATIWWRWKVKDVASRLLLTQVQTIVFQDTRFQWQSQSMPQVDVYWHALDDVSAHDLIKGMELNLSRIRLDVIIPNERKPKVFIYADVSEVRSSMLFLQDWVGALAIPSYNTILIPVSQNQLDWARKATAHEMTHLLVGEATFGPFGNIPVWLNEGLARYAEGDSSTDDQQRLNDAISANTLISVRSLGSSFPADELKARLAYAESNSLVTFLIDGFGWDRLRQLLAVFKDGSTYDNALRKVYGFDITGLEQRWRAHIGAR